ncbi:hypothetical protein CR492_18575 [Methylocella silvestris]|uniref:Helix-turn-helix domain-containing protein n=2 Tax=Methylocella silvestris TaxID=199596 RepID=A0A2J7TCL1_METSI|nr:hypothetical protein CR492_18575 [Methylocella silvestris]
MRGKSIRAGISSDRRQEKCVDPQLLPLQKAPELTARFSTSSPEDYGLKNPTYSVVETLKLLSIGRNTLYRLIAAGELFPIYIGKRTLFSAIEITRFLNSLQGKVG